jgi:subfamily B ATP-binding cassette protein MsbA
MWAIINNVKYIGSLPNVLNNVYWTSMSNGKNGHSGAPSRRETDLRILIRTLKYFLPYRWHIVLGFISSLFVSAATAGSAWLIKPALDQIFIEKNAQALLYVPFAFIILTFVKGLGRYVQSWTMNYSALHVLETLRKELFHKIVWLPMRFYEESHIGVLMARILNDVMMIRQSLPAFVQMIRQILTMIGLMGVVFHQDFRLACMAIIALPLAGAPFVWFSRALRRYGRRSAEIMADISGMLQELLSGIRIIKAFASERSEIRRFDKENVRIVSISMRQLSVSDLAAPVMELIGAFGTGAIIWVGGMEVIHGNMTPGTFFSFIAALIMLYDPVKNISLANKYIQEAMAGAERVFAILDDPDLVMESGGTHVLSETFEQVCFENVSLRYADDAPFALSGIDLTVKAGERIALVGPSGAGKTSLVNLIPRFYSPTRGQILLNGRPISDYTLDSLRHAIAIVSQDTFLFDMSIAENIAYGRKDGESIDHARVGEMARAAYADNFIAELPQMFDTRVGERGAKLSGGQKQRLTIARALFKDTSILILDEATSALDSESEKIVQRALDNLMEGRTSFVIAHRLSTILGADRIVVLDQGRIIDIGSHEELIKRCPLYVRLYEMQFGNMLETQIL